MGAPCPHEPCLRRTDSAGPSAGGAVGLWTGTAYTVGPGSAPGVDGQNLPYRKSGKDRHRYGDADPHRILLIGLGRYVGIPNARFVLGSRQ